MKLKLTNPKEEHHAFRKDVVALLDKHTGKLPATDMLAIAAYLVGQLIAMQDQRHHDPAQIMALVSKNIEEGNKQVLDDLNATQGSG